MLPEPAIRLVFVTFPSIESAREIGSALVESQLAACVNLIPAIESIYRWHGRVQRDAEVLGIFKTTPENLSPLEARLREMHPYDVPEIIALTPESASEAYAAWVGHSCPQVSAS